MNINLFKILLPLYIITMGCKAQSNLTFNKIENQLRQYLCDTGELYKKDCATKEGEYGFPNIFIYGAINGHKKGKLKNGVYRWGLTRTHANFHYFIYDEGQLIILNLAKKEELIKSIDTLLKYCEKQKYCSDITQKYVKEMIHRYYNKNMYPRQGRDQNCINGVINTDDLP